VYYEGHKTRKQARQKERYEANKEAFLRRTKRWEENNKEKRKLWLSEYYQKNKTKYRSRAARRRCQMRMATPAWVNIEQLHFIYAECPEKHHVDHIIPISGKTVCGLHVPWNLQYLTASENIAKSNKLIEA
jgi:5-methylcytosine-specific restriction endonuclease McrA